MSNNTPPIVNTSKPHKGRFEAFFHRELSNGQYVYFGKFLDHPRFQGLTGHTSAVLLDFKDEPRHAGDSYEIETLNSRYTIIPSTR